MLGVPQQYISILDKIYIRNYLSNATKKKSLKIWEMSTCIHNFPSGAVMSKRGKIFQSPCHDAWSSVVASGWCSGCNGLIIHFFMADVFSSF